MLTVVSTRRLSILFFIRFNCLIYSYFFNFFHFSLAGTSRLIISLPDFVSYFKSFPLMMNQVQPPPKTKAIYRSSPVTELSERLKMDDSIFSLSLLAKNFKFNLGQRMNNQLEDLAPHLAAGKSRFMLKKDKDLTTSSKYTQFKPKENLLVAPQSVLLQVFDPKFRQELIEGRDKITALIQRHRNATEESVTWPMGKEVRDDFTEWSGGLRYFLKLSNYHAMRKDLKMSGDADLDCEMTAQIGYVKGELEGFTTGQSSPSGIFTCTCTELLGIIDNPLFRKLAFHGVTDDDDVQKV